MFFHPVSSTRHLEPFFPFTSSVQVFLAQNPTSSEIHGIRLLIPRSVLSSSLVSGSLPFHIFLPSYLVIATVTWIIKHLISQFLYPPPQTSPPVFKYQTLIAGNCSSYKLEPTAEADRHLLTWFSSNSFLKFHWVLRCINFSTFHCTSSLSFFSSLSNMDTVFYQHKCSFSYTSDSLFFFPSVVLA